MIESTSGSSTVALKAEKQPREIKCLNHGFVRLVNHMGDDNSIVQAARVSYGAGTKTAREDAALITYLMRKRHTSPFEMCEWVFHCKMPIFVARQWVRHRTACLSGGVTLQFDLPGGIKRRGNQLYTLTVKEIFDRFQPTVNKTRPDKQRYQHHKRDRVQSMKLRCIDENTQAVKHANIVDIWGTGIKKVFTVTTENSRSDYNKVTASADHLFLTENGWLKLSEIVKLDETSSIDVVNAPKIICIGPGVDTGVVPHFNAVDTATENWKPIVGWESYYEVSDQGRVRRVMPGQGVKKVARCKKITVFNGHAFTSLNKPGIQTTGFVHVMMLEAFVGTAPAGMECCHNDGNGLNNLLGNLRWDTPKSNGEDRIRDDATTWLKSTACKVLSVTLVGEEQTYDIEVSGPWHNFSADGMIVHNSVNEVSARYSEMKDEFFVPEIDTVRKQSKKNKQGREDPIDEVDAATVISSMQGEHVDAYAKYKKYLETGVAREMARVNLPLSIYTEWYWKMDLHNLLHFLKLRMDAHAQYEIRVYAEAIYELIKPIVPVTIAAFDEYVRNAVTVPATIWKEISKFLMNSTNGLDATEAIKIVEALKKLDIK